MTGIAFGESPRWHDERLWFSDWGAQQIIAVDLEGKSEVIVRVPSFPFCIDWLPDGRLLVVSARYESYMLGAMVTHLSREADRYVVASGDRRFEAEHVVVATGANQVPKVPAFADELHSSILQLHSSHYRHPAQLQDGAVLVVGAGNSGAEIAFEVSRTHPTYLSGEPSGQLPVRHGPAMARFVFPVIRFVGHHVLTLRSPIGRKAQPKFISHGAPLIRVKLKDLAAAGVEQVPRTVGIEDGRPVLEDGRVLDVSNVIWCTGFREEFPWINLPVFGEDGRPLHKRGVVVRDPGLYFVGLRFQYAATSDVLPGVGRDAEYIAKHIASRVPNGRPTAHALAGARRPEALDRGRTGVAEQVLS